MDKTEFEATVKQDTPRLVIMWKQAPNGDEVFQWGVVGNIPVLSAVGAVAELQHKIMAGACLDVCPQPAVVVAWVGGKPYYFADPDVLTPGCLGMLEMVKSTLVDTHRARSAAAQQIILADKNGRPVG